MSRGDKTGPNGTGPMTGRAAGYCVGYSVPGYRNPRREYCRGFRRRWGRGFRRGWFGYPSAYSQAIPQQTPEKEVKVLENYHKDLVAEKAYLEKEIDDIKTRIEDMKKKPKE